MTLEMYLKSWSNGGGARRPVADVVCAIAKAGQEISAILARGQLEGNLAEVVSADNGAGDGQKYLDVLTDDIITRALAETPVAWIASEERDEPAPVNPGAPLVVALDPLDGSSNIDTNVSVGTIFSVLRADANNKTSHEHFFQTGRAQVAAGYVIYGPSCAFVLTVGDGTHIFTLDRTKGDFYLTRRNIQVPEHTQEYAINASNYRHWSPAIRAYVDDCVAGSDGSRAENFNMRWVASMVADCHRILMRGGVYLYPRDKRKGYHQGRLRLIYEGNPIAWLIEEAGGCATDGFRTILDIVPQSLHQRTPLIFGSRVEVERIARYKADQHSLAERAPLLTPRGLFRS